MNNALLQENTFNTDFNPSPPHWLHIDLNSCFASIEQQANPFLRGKPIAVAAYTTPRGCILAPSIEAKHFGVKTGMRVIDGKKLCPELIVMESDPPKYRFVNQALTKLLNEYTPHVSVRSIDEMLLNFEHLKKETNKYLLLSLNNDSFSPLRTCPDFKSGLRRGLDDNQSLLSSFSKGETSALPRRGVNGIRTTLKTIGQEIKTRIKREIGDWLTVSIGISTNPYLAKLAAGLNKPDGLDEIHRFNILGILSEMKLVDLPYIKERNAARLNRVGIHTPVDFYFASKQQLKAAFESINGEYWYRRLHGLEVDQVEWGRKSIGHSYALPKFTGDISEIKRLLCKLVIKMGKRIRKNNLTVQGIHLAFNFADGKYWHQGHKFPSPMYSDDQLFHAACHLLDKVQPLKPVRVLAVSSFALQENLYAQMTLFHDEVKKRALARAIDQINDKWGEFVVTPALIANMNKEILDRISFGQVRDMTQVI